MDSLNEKPGVSRSVSLFSQKFLDMSVYDRRDSSIEELLQNYKDCHPGDENNQSKHAGFHTLRISRS